MALRLYKPCFRAFLLPRGAPDPKAPPCIRQRFFPLTAGDMQDLPDRVFAPQRGLDNIERVLRGWLLVIGLFPATNRHCHTVRFANDRHCRMLLISKRSWDSRWIVWCRLWIGVSNIAYNRLTAWSHEHTRRRLATSPVAFRCLQLLAECSSKLIDSI
jgi:hypothetical protein